MLAYAAEYFGNVIFERSMDYLRLMSLNRGGGAFRPKEVASSKRLANDLMRENDKYGYFDKAEFSKLLERKMKNLDDKLGL